MKVKEHEKVADKHAIAAEELDDSDDDANEDGTDAYKSENNPPAALAQPFHEKMLYDTRIRRKNVLALNEKVAAIREYEKSPVYKRIGRMFHCSPDQIKRIVQQKDSILEAWEQRTRRCHDAKTLEMKVVRVSMLGKAVFDWLRRMIYYQDIQITDGLIQKTALQFKSAMGLQNFFPHQDWCDKFRQTYKIHTTDSKLLNIGYTQGYSVQIKDVMKDVLNECTPDAGSKTQSLDDVGDDDDVEEIKEECDNTENTKAQDGNAEQEAKRRRLKSGGNAPSTKSNAAGNMPQPTGSTLNATGNPIVKRINITNPNGNMTNNQLAANLQKKNTPSPVMHNLATPQLTPFRQLVALPLQGNVAGMPQKVLVATPITPAGQMPGAKPMTMTIIPLATIAQSQSMQATSTTAAATVTATATATPTTLTAALATATATAATPASDAEKSNVPPPMLDIKKEIKQEPVEIKQEYISDAEEDEQTEQEQTESNEVAMKTNTALQENAINNNITTFTPEVDTSSSGSMDVAERVSAPETADDENIALANLRRLIQTQGKLVATSTASATVVRPIAASAVPPLAPKPTILPATLNPSTSGTTERQSLPTSTTAITCIPAANISAMSRALCFTPPLPPLTKAPDAVINRLANKRKHATNNMHMLPPIKSCSEARKYLKLLEDFALVKENFRLIGLITRADEVLRELDGDDDVDVD
nr:pneumococcal serine-rich repeat protein [Bactrocera oleae]